MRSGIKLVILRSALIDFDHHGVAGVLVACITGVQPNVLSIDGKVVEVEVTIRGEVLGHRRASSFRCHSL